MPATTATIPYEQDYASTRKFAENILQGRDETHGFGHCAIVYRHAMGIFDDILSEKEPENVRLLQIIEKKVDARKVIAISAYLHDVLDHKYDSTQATADKMEAHIKTVCSEEEAKWVYFIMEHVSYSAQKKGKFKIGEIPEDMRLLRNIVSDADKLEAIGMDGVHRCLDFTKEKNPHYSQEECRKHAAIHCDEKLLLLCGDFIYTAPGKRRAEPLHQDVVEWRSKVTI